MGIVKLPEHLDKHQVMPASNQSTGMGQSQGSNTIRVFRLNRELSEAMLNSLHPRSCTTIGPRAISSSMFHVLHQLPGFGSRHTPLNAML